MKIFHVVMHVLQGLLLIYVEWQKKLKQEKLDQENEKLKEDPNAWFDDHFGSTSDGLSNDQSDSTGGPYSTDQANPDKDIKP